jgi:hypothetical protein
MKAWFQCFPDSWVSCSPLEHQQVSDIFSLILVLITGAEELKDVRRWYFHIALKHKVNFGEQIFEEQGSRCPYQSKTVINPITLEFPSLARTTISSAVPVMPLE